MKYCNTPNRQFMRKYVIRIFSCFNPYLLLKNIFILCLLGWFLNSCNLHNKISLFNSENLEGWYTYLEKHGKNNDPDKVFSVHNGVLHISGKEFGYLCTSKSYSDFRLTVEFKWGEAKHPPRDTTKRDSGILYHFEDNNKDTIWPKSIECQIEEGDCGDFWLVGGTQLSTRNHWENEWGMKHIFRTQDNEKPHGEWNTIEIISDHGMLRHYVNGLLVNEGEYASVRKGKILLQSEGAEVFYRNLELQVL
jgi:hypothetical protein